MSAKDVGRDQAVRVRARYRHQGILQEGTKAVTVRNIAPTTVTIAGPDTLDERSTAQYRALARYGDGTEVDVTQQVRWRARGRAQASNRSGSEGEVTAGPVPRDRTVRLTATLGRGRFAVRETREVTVRNVD